jgi:hypothetical protein
VEYLEPDDNEAHAPGQVCAVHDGHHHEPGCAAAARRPVDPPGVPARSQRAATRR